MRRSEFTPSTLPPPDSPYWTGRVDSFLAVIDPGMTIRYVSKNCEKIVGYSASELVGRTSVEFLRPEEVVDVMNMHQDLLRSGATERILRTYRKDGSAIELAMQVIPVREAGTVKELRMVCQVLPLKIKA